MVFHVKAQTGQKVVEMEKKEGEGGCRLWVIGCRSVYCSYKTTIHAFFYIARFIRIINRLRH